MVGASSFRRGLGTTSPISGRLPMQVYAIYVPAHHTPGKVQATAAAAEADKDTSQRLGQCSQNTRPINTADLVVSKWPKWGL